MKLVLDENLDDNIFGMATCVEETATSTTALKEGEKLEGESPQM